MRPANLAKVFGAAVLLFLLLFVFRRGSREEPLLRAIAHGDTQAVERILRSDRSLANRRFRIGNQTPLQYAVGCRNPEEAIDLLISSGADINARSGGFNLTPLQWAAWGGRIAAVRALLAHEPDVNALNAQNQTAMHYAIGPYMGAVLSGGATNVGKEIMELLLEHGADINAGYPILLSASSWARCTSLIDFLVSRGANVDVQGPTGGGALLSRVINSGDRDAVQTILRSGPDLRAKGGNGTALETAVTLGRFDIALLLHNHVLEGQSNTLGFAAARGSVDELRSRLQSDPQAVNEKDVFGFTPLHCAAMAGRKDTAEILLSRKADIDATDRIELHPLEWAAFAGQLPVVKLLLERRATDADTALFLAVQQQHTSVAQFLLEHGADPNAKYRMVTALHTAARQGNIDLARLLLKHGARVNAVEQNHMTPLEYAVTETSKEMVELLFAHGAAIPEKPPGYLSVFHEWALGAGDTNIAEVLLARNANVNASGSDGRMPLHLAALQGQLQAVEWLLQNGANVNARNSKGKTPLGLLHGRRGGWVRKDAAELLQKSGAKE